MPKVHGVSLHEFVSLVQGTKLNISSHLQVSLYLSYHIDKNMVKIYKIYVSSSQKKSEKLNNQVRKCYFAKH